MACEYCRWNWGHHNQCPNYEPQRSNYNCSECGENILIGEEYIGNDNGEYAHWECVDYATHLASFLGYDIRTMESEDDDY